MRSTGNLQQGTISGSGRQSRLQCFPVHADLVRNCKLHERSEAAKISMLQQQLNCFCATAQMLFVALVACQSSLRHVTLQRVYAGKLNILQGIGIRVSKKKTQ